jgi:hypothetical protein
MRRAPDCLSGSQTTAEIFSLDAIARAKTGINRPASPPVSLIMVRRRRSLAAYTDSGPALECTYEVEAEGVWSPFYGGYREYPGTKDTQITCKINGGGVCWCE